MRNPAIVLAMLIVLFVLLTGCGGNTVATNQGSLESANNATVDSVTWIANSVWPDDNYVSQGLKDFAEMVDEATNGKVKLDVKTGGALMYQGPELLKAVRDGMVPVSDYIINGVVGDEPLFGLSSLPFLISNFEEGKLLSEISRPYYEKVTEEKWNQKILYVNPWPAQGFWTKDELKTIDDMKGLKMRTVDENGAVVVEAIGGTPYQLAFAEVYSSLATGIIDSVMTSSPTAVDAKFWEVLDYYIPANVTMGSGFVAVNLDEFNKLDKETQEILLECGRKMEAIMWERVAKLDKEMEAIVTENGMTILPPSKEFINDLSGITEELRRKWLETAPAEAHEIIKEFYAAIEKL